MSRPTRPPGPPYPEDEQPPPPAAPPPAAPPPAGPPPDRPRFTPRQAAPPSPPASPAEGAAQPSFTPNAPAPSAPAGGRHGPPAGGRHSGQHNGQQGGQHGGRHAGGSTPPGRPRPTFTPREGYTPPPDRRRAAPPLTAFLPPVPAGYPQQPFPQAYDYPEGPSRPSPRFTPVDRRAPRGDDDGRTQVLEPDASPTPSTGPQPVTDRTGPNLARSSKAMALGTIASRGTGFLRTLVLVVALGGGSLADAYNNSNTLPNTVYYLMLGGIFTSVVVPLLVRAAKEDPDRGEGYAERIFTLGVVSLLVVTVLGTALSGPIVDLYASNLSVPGEHHVTLIFAYYFIPQIFFYGMDSLLGAILNTRGRFGANMWTPVINNIVVILVGALFIVTEGTSRTTGGKDGVSAAGIHLLAIGTTLGIVIQSVCLFPIVRRAGFSMRLRWDIRRDEIREIGRMSGWMFGYVVSQWLGNLVAQRVANAAANSAALAAAKAHHLSLSAAAAQHLIPDVGYSVYSYAWQLFQLPYAIVGISVISALLPRMSGHATERRYSLVREDFSTGVRIASVLVVPAAVFLAALGAPLCEALFAYGAFTPRAAQYTGEVFGAFSLGLVPFMLTQLQLRVFYSFQENRTPAIIGMVMLIVGVVGDLVALTVLPATQTVIGLAFAYDLVTLAGAAISWPLLLRRVGSLDGWRIARSLIRMFLATLPGLVFALVIMAVLRSFLHPGPVYGLVATVLGGGGALLLYAFCSRLLGIEEFRTLMRSVAGRFG